MSDSVGVQSVGVDNPITDPRDDVLGRREAAKSFANRVLKLDASQGVVVGVFGPWGSGKTSFLSLVKYELDGQPVHILDFNPWVFSGTEQLVERFFVELTNQIRGPRYKDLPKTGRALKEYGDALRASTSPIKWFAAVVFLWVSGLVGQSGDLFGIEALRTINLIVLLVGGALGIAAVALKIVGASLSHRHKSIYELRNRVQHALRKSKKRIIVVVDDVDRLTPDEIRDLLKLVRLTASFSKTIYIVACDRDQVTKALGQGDHYLEKIVQIPFNLPQVPRYNLEEQAIVEIEATLAGRQFDDEIGSYVVNYVIFPLIRNLRDVRRYTAAIRETVAALDGKVALSDILALEAIRVFLPQTFESIAPVFDLLTYPTAAEVNVQSTGWKELLTDRKQSDIVGQHIKISPEHENLVRNVFGELHLRTNNESGESGYSHNGERYRRERKVACRSVIRLYLERVEGPDMVTLRDAGRALQNMHDVDSFLRVFRDIERDRWPYVLAHLRAFANGEFDAKHVEAGVIGLLNLTSDRQTPVLGYGSHRNTVEIIRKLLQVWGSGDRGYEELIRRVLSQTKSLTGLSWFIQLIVGDERDTGIEASAEAKALAVRELRRMIRATDTHRLIEELDLIEILRVARHGTGGDDCLVVPSAPEVTFHILYKSEQSWNLIEDLCGGREEARERVQCMVGAQRALQGLLDETGIPQSKAERVFEGSIAWLATSSRGQETP